MTASQEPAAVAAYFGPLDPRRGEGREHAIVAETFTPETGWKRSPVRKRISGSWARAARRSGITTVALTSAGRLADFRIEELTR